MSRKKEPNREEEDEEKVRAGEGSPTFVQISQSTCENLVGRGLSTERVSNYHEAVTHQHHLIHLNQSHATVRDIITMSKINSTVSELIVKNQ